MTKGRTQKKSSQRNKLAFVLVVAIVATVFLQFGHSRESGVVVAAAVTVLGLYVFILARRHTLESADKFEVLLSVSFLAWWGYHQANGIYPSGVWLFSVVCGYMALQLVCIARECHKARFEREFNILAIMGSAAWCLGRGEFYFARDEGNLLVSMSRVMEYLYLIALPPLVFNFLIEPVVSYFRHDAVADVKRGTMAVAAVPKKAITATQEMASIKLGAVKSANGGRGLHMPAMLSIKIPGRKHGDDPRRQQVETRAVKTGSSD